MKPKVALIAVIICWFAVALAQENALGVDSVNGKFRGLRLFPSEKPTSSEIAYATDTKIYKILKTNDTIVVVTDNAMVFENPLMNLTRAQIKRKYVKGRKEFCDDDAPETVFISLGKDTIFYIRNLPMPNQPYELEQGVLESFELLKVNRSFSDFVEILRLGQFVDLSINTIILIHSSGAENLWAKQYGITSDDYVSANLFAFTRREDEILRVMISSTYNLCGNSIIIW